MHRRCSSVAGAAAPPDRLVGDGAICKAKYIHDGYTREVAEDADRTSGDRRRAPTLHDEPAQVARLPCSGRHDAVLGQRLIA